MSRLALLAVLLVGASTRAPAQAPLTADSVRHIVAAVAGIARQTDSVRHYADTLQAEAHELILDFADHNKGRASTRRGSRSSALISTWCASCSTIAPPISRKG